jgi:hypothetical protein
VTKRKPITPKMKVDALLWHFDIKCYLCTHLIQPDQSIQWDHIWALALGGPHDISNIVPVCYACHHKKTHGAGATTAGSDIGKISKERRIIRTKKMAVHKRKPGAKKPPSDWPSRKLQGRGFEKRRAS